DRPGGKSSGGAMSTSRSDRLLRWYPRAWRERYGDEFVALIEDTYPARKIPYGERARIARGGLSEHVHALSLGDVESSANDRVRTGSLLVLCAWALFVVAGAGFAKMTE